MKCIAEAIKQLGVSSLSGENERPHHKKAEAEEKFLRTLEGSLKNPKPT